jgi:hypothetical protein
LSNLSTIRSQDAAANAKHYEEHARANAPPAIFTPWSEHGYLPIVESD